MLNLVGVSYKLPRKGEDPFVILDDVTCSAPDGHVLGIVGPTLSGKTTLIEILGGLIRPTLGSVIWNNRDSRKRPLHPNQIGFIPAGDGDIPQTLTVRENLISALMLRVEGIQSEAAREKAAQLLVLTGLETAARQRYNTLSLSQKRRAKMAIALVTDPAVVLCDGFTDRLDARSGRELGALLKDVASAQPDRLVVHATDDLANIDCHDSVLLLHDGYSCYHGPVRAIAHYFSIKSSMELFAKLAKRPGSRWGESWARHRDSYYNAFKLGTSAEQLASAADGEEDGNADRVKLPSSDEADKDDEAKTAEPEPATETGLETGSIVPATPSVWFQTRHLARRRWTQFRRNKGDWIPISAIILASPVLLLLLVLPNVADLREAAIAEDQSSLGQEVLWTAAFTCLAGVFIQVLLVLFAAVRVGAREIAMDRKVFERERISGLSTTAHLLSRLAFAFPLTIGSSLSLGVFIEMVTGGFPGNSFARLVLLVLSGVAFTMICLGVSANSRTKERAYSIAMTLLLANVLLSGALLAFHRILGSVVQPFATAHYAWSGSMDAMKGTPVFAPLTQFVPTWFATPAFAAIMLTIHGLVGASLLLWGLRRTRRPE